MPACFIFTPAAIPPNPAPTTTTLGVPAGPNSSSAVAKRAGVNERTVYRHFSGERELHDAVMRRLQEEAGIPFDGLTLDQYAAVVARLFDYLSSFSAAPRTPSDPTFVAVDERRRQALLAAVRESTNRWSRTDRERAAPMQKWMPRPNVRCWPICRWVSKRSASG